METLAAAVGAGIILGYAILRAKIYISLDYRRQGEDDVMTVFVHSLYRLVSYELTIPVIKWSERGIPWLRTGFRSGNGEQGKAATDDDGKDGLVTSELPENVQWRDIIREIRFFKAMYRKFTDHIRRGLVCEKFFWRSRLGCDDPALTSLFIGLGWVLKSWLITKLKKRLKVVSEPSINVLPAYLEPGFQTEFKCIFSIRFGNVINAALVMLNFVWKGVRFDGRTPNPGINEDSNGKYQGNG